MGFPGYGSSVGSDYMTGRNGISPYPLAATNPQNIVSQLPDRNSKLALHRYDNLHNSVHFPEHNSFHFLAMENLIPVTVSEGTAKN